MSITKPPIGAHFCWKGSYESVQGTIISRKEYAEGMAKQGIPKNRLVNDAYVYCYIYDNSETIYGSPYGYFAIETAHDPNFIIFQDSFERMQEIYQYIEES